ncbi:MAG: Na+:solute symporter [Opitutaceae bacterium]|nr:Na+:solute symporter [Opitutaceae bacterium]
MQTIDWIVIALYLLSQLAIGLYCERKSGHSVEDFFLAGRKLTWWLLGTSMVATAFASDTPLFITKLVRQYGVSGAWYYWNASLNGLFAAFFISYLWRRTRVISDAEFRELRYSGTPGKAVRAGWALYWASASSFFSLAWVILAMVKISKAVFELSDTMMIAGHELQTSVVVVAISLVITGLYSAASGLWGVIITDFIQFILAFLGTALLAWFAVDHVGGLSSLKAQIAAMPEAGASFFDVIPTGGQVLIVFWVGLTIQWWSSAWVDGGMMMAQRSLAARSEKHSELGRYWGHLAQMGIIVWPWAIAALCSLIIFPSSQYPGVAADPESAYPLLVLKVMPPGLRGVVVAGLFAAFMSTVCTLLNSNASYVVNDIYKRFFVPSAEPRHYVRVGRVVTLVIMGIGGYMATVSTSVLGLSQLMAQFTGGVGAIFALRWLWWRINAWSEITAYLGSGVLGILLNVDAGIAFARRAANALTPKSLAHQIDHFFLAILPGPEGWAFKLAIIAGTTTLLSLLVTLLTPPTEMEHLHRFYRKVKPYGPGWARVRQECGPVKLEPAQVAFDWRRLVWGSVFFFATFWAIGKLTFGFWVEAGVSGLIMAISGYALYSLWQRLPEPQNEGEASTN